MINHWNASFFGWPRPFLPENVDTFITRSRKVDLVALDDPEMLNVHQSVIKDKLTQPESPQLAGTSHKEGSTHSCLYCRK